MLGLCFLHPRLIGDCTLICGLGEKLPEQPGAFTFGLAASSESDLSDQITIECISKGIGYRIVIRTVKNQHSGQL